LRRPGTIVVEYLEAIPPGLPKREFMSVLESRMEEAITRLLREPPVQINLSRVKASEP
jgi:1-acyl-sn-glycerol-3-phosphate acyltransferase